MCMYIYNSIATLQAMLFKSDDVINQEVKPRKTKNNY